MAFFRFALLGLVVFGMALPLSVRADDEKTEKKDEKTEKKDEKTEKKDEKTEKKEEKLKDSEYFPLAVGTVWTYDVNGGQVAKITVAEHEEVKGILCARLETEVNGAVVGTEHISVKDDGVYRNTYNGSKIDPPLRILKLPYKKGADWKVKSKQGPITVAGKLVVDEEDDLDVPAGTFKALVVKGEFEVDGQTFSNACYFAKGKGMVKQETQLNGQTINIELKRFKLGTGKVVSEDEDDEKKPEEKKPEGSKPKKKPEGKKDGESPKDKDF